MTFATVKELQASRKFLLIRINPARYIVDDLVPIGGGLYTLSTDFIVSAVEELGNSLTKVSGIPSISQYSFDETTSLLTIYPSSLPSSTNPIVLYHYLFFTGEIYRTWYQDPEDNLTPLRDWLPLLKESPTITQSIDDLLAGILSISTSNVEILNNNFELNEYLTVNDSFYNKKIQIWLCLEDESNIQKVFEGTISSLSINRESLSLNVRDIMSMLDNPALIGDTSDEAYYTLDATPNLYPSSNGLVNPFIVGTCSRYQTLSESVTNLSEAKRLDYTTLYYAVCTNYTTNISTSTNREYGICRTASNGFQDFTHTVIAVDNTDPNFTRYTSSALNVAKMYIGDTFIVNVSGTDYYGRILFVNTSSNYIYTTKMSAVSGTPTILGNNCPSILVSQDDVYYYLLYGRDYTATITTTSYGNKNLSITFANNFESNFSINPLDPSSDNVLYRVRPTKIFHGDLVKLICESAGLTINNASIVSANALFPIYASLSIPKFDENDIDVYYTYLQHVLESVFGYVFLNNDFEIEYDLFQNPTSVDEITDTEILKSTFSISVEYQDIISKIIAYNPHANSIEFVAKTGVSLNSPKSQFLHGFSRTTRFQHCLEDITTRLSQILSYRSNRVAKYQLDTATKNLDSQIGDDFKLNKDGLLGELSKEVKLISIDKDSTQSTLILTDLGV